MIVLHQFPHVNGMNMSPFCLKVETFLKLAHIPYETRNVPPWKAPKKKLPYIKDGDATVADSSHILMYLVQKFGIDWDQKHQEQSLAAGRAFTLMLEDHTIWPLIHTRWINNDIWPHTRRDFFAGLPGPAQRIVPRLVRRKVRKTLWLQGMGRHSEKEQHEFVRDDLHALDRFLGQGPFILGQNLSTYDPSVYAVLKSMTYQPHGGGITALIEGYPRLREYVGRIDQMRSSP